MDEDDERENSHYAAIGRVATEWSFLESLIDLWCLELTDLPAFGFCFTAQISGIGRKLDAFMSLAKLVRHMPDDLVLRLEKFAKDAKALGERRNRIIHDVWDFDHPNTPRRIEATARMLLRLEQIPVPTENLLSLVLEIDEAGDRFHALAQDIKNSPLPSPEK